MVRGGGICVAEPPGSPFDRVSPRIRALQDRLLDSLPADGAWECLSPAQREAIISLHRARITRNIEAKSRSPERGKRNGSNGNHSNKNFISKGLNKYGRCRSFEDKLESETDDSGVRLLSGETNSSSTSNSHSHEDDSSDPGVKQGRFTKSPRVDRIIRKEGKTPYDVGKRKNVPNGIGNVNKIISKQLNRSAPPNPAPPACKATLDCRNILGVKQRSRISSNNFIFDPDEDREPPKSEQISRKNILERYRDPKPLEAKKDRLSTVVKLDERVRCRYAVDRIDYDDFELESDQTPKSDRNSSPFGEGVRFSRPHNRHSQSRHDLMDEDTLSDPFEMDSGMFDRKEDSKDKDSGLDMSSGKANKILLNSGYDYRTHFNLEGLDKYSSNWNSIVLSRSSDSPMRPHRERGRGSHASPSSHLIHDIASIPQFRRPTTDQVAQMSRYSKPYVEANLSHSHHSQTPSYPERSGAKKYIRSKSLDRKYLDDSSEDESDFEVRRRTERMRRYAKANQEWGLHRDSSSGGRNGDPHFSSRRPIEDTTRPKAKSSIDLSRISRSKDDFEEAGDTNFQSRSNILNKWKSEDFDLSSKPQVEGDFDRTRWRRRSCDFELEMSDGETRKRMKDADRRKWQRRSCDFELDHDDFFDLGNDRDWDSSVSNEMKILRERNKKQNPKKELQQTHPSNTIPKKLDPSSAAKAPCPVSEKTPYPTKMPRKKNSKEFEKVVDLKQPDPRHRKYVQNEDYRCYPRYPTPPGHPICLKGTKGAPLVANGKNKTPSAFRGKLRLFKAILSF